MFIFQIKNSHNQLIYMARSLSSKHSLEQLLQDFSIVEQYTVSKFSNHQIKIKNQPKFLEDYLKTYNYNRNHTQLYDLLDKMMEQQEILQVNSVVQQYKENRKVFQDMNFKKFINSSSQHEIPERFDSSMQEEKISSPQPRLYQVESDTSFRSDSSNFSKRQKKHSEQMKVQQKFPLLKRISQKIPVQKVIKKQIQCTIPIHENKINNHNNTDSNHNTNKNQERLEKIQKLKQVGCNCKKSNCLKMYCECFHLQIFCSQNCCCKGCGNLQKTEYHKQAVISALSRNPRAFQEEVPTKVGFKLEVNLDLVKKGCKCRKTKCLKKYCECYNTGQKCGIFCKCQGCQNDTVNRLKIESSSHLSIMEIQ